MAMDDAELERYFAAARRDAQPPADLVARVLADADGEATVAAPRRRRAWWSGWATWGGISGLVAAGAAGVAVGLADPYQVGEVLAGSVPGLWSSYVPSLSDLTAVGLVD